MKTKTILFGFLYLIMTSFNANNLKELSPISEYFPDLSIKAQEEFKQFEELLSKENPSESEKKELEKLFETYDETTGSIWDIIGGGCSWYCGGGNYKIVASSKLKSNRSIHYSAKKANDLSYETAWVEGKKDSGIGEYLDYYFKAKSPEVTNIIVSNGYMKTAKTWKSNNRVKRLKLYINNEDYAILNLKDSRSSQSFKVNLNWQKNIKEDIILRFEILDVYRGERYDDTAITEIHFDGIGVH